MQIISANNAKIFQNWSFFMVIQMKLKRVVLLLSSLIMKNFQLQIEKKQEA